MAYTLQTEAEIQDLGTIKYVDAPFDEGLELITSQGGEPISARNLAFARTNAALNPRDKYEHSLSQNGSWIKEGDIYLPNEKLILLLRNSLLFSPEFAKQGVQSHSQSKEFFIEEGLAKQYLEKASESSDSEVFPLIDLNPIKTRGFYKDKRALWLFQDQAENYGRFLLDNNIEEMPLVFDSQDYTNYREQPYANQLWLRRLAGGDWSGLCGGRFLYFSDRLHGVFSNLGEAQAQKISRGKSEPFLYSNKELDTIAKLIQDVKEGRVGNSKLEGVLSFMEKLPRKK